MDYKELIEIKQKLINDKLCPKSFIAYDQKIYFFNWIFDCCSKSVLEIRNANHVLNFMSNSHKISLIEHSNFLSNYLNLPRIDFMILEGKKIVGGVNIVLTKKGLEIGKYIGNKKYLKKGIAKLSTINLLYFIKDYLPKETNIFSRTMANNYDNIALNKKIGFEIFKEADDAGFILMKKVI